MKPTIPFILAAFILGCGQEKQIQMSLSDVQLVKIDTVVRYPNSSEKILTWRSDDRVEYVTFAPIASYYPIGSRMKVMLKR